METYRDVYGCTACIRTIRSGESRLTIRISTGRLIHAKDYPTIRGARIAMGRMSDGWTKVKEEEK